MFQMHFDVTIASHKFDSSILISLGKSSPLRSTYDSNDPFVVPLRSFVESRTVRYHYRQSKMYPFSCQMGNSLAYL